ncbi:MAG: ATP-binding protein [Deltaproteobacteria bacterium]|jgi:PAS domain S-box-containing protein|nr:ATP-binding protein [Deltaproteobacteria bacterium]
MAETLKGRPKLLDSIPASFILTDIHARILYVNQQAELFFGYAKEELEGERLRFLFLEEDLLYFLPNIVFLTRYKNGFEGEVLLRQKDGTKIFVHLSTSSFKEGGEVFLTFFFQEIQRLKVLEREKLEMERWASLGRMVEEISHQFRNPIASIGGYSRRLSKNLSPSAKGQAWLSQILKQTNRLENILKRVEEYVRIPRPVFQRERIQDVVERVLPEFSKKAQEKEASFRVDSRGMEGDGRLFIDGELIHRVISHLLQNSLEAIQARTRGGLKKVVDVSLFDDGDNVGVSVVDRGQGISKKNLKLIFEPFFSTHPSQVGLGLTFVRRVMEEHRGRIRVDSRLRRGTTVTLFFPKDRRRKVRREFVSPEAREEN